MQLVSSPKLRSWALPFGLAVLIAAIVGGAVWIGRGGNGHHVGAGSSGTPAMLHLTSYASGGVAAAAAGGAPDSSGAHPGASDFQLVGTLPDGSPPDQAVWRLKQADASDAGAVADALGLSGTPLRIDGGWALRSEDGHGNLMVVRDDGSWSYGVDCSPERPVSNEDATVGCALATGVASAAPVPAGPAGAPMSAQRSGPSESDVRAAAAKVFDKLGLGDASTTYYGGPDAQVVANPKVHGLDVSGWSTYVVVDSDSSVMAAAGWLSGLDEGDSYPVITAQKAYEELQAQPRPAIEMCMRRTDGKPGCAPIPPTQITGAHLGLMLDYDGASPVLVPAWLFDVKDGTEPLTQIAVDPSFLAPPPQPTDEPGATGSGSGGGSGGGVAPGNVGQLVPNNAPSAEPKPGIETPNTK